MQDLFKQEDSVGTTTDTSLENVFLRITKDFSLSKVRELSKNYRSKKDLINYQYSYGEIVLII